MKKLTRIGAALIIGGSLTTGLAAAQTASVDTTGPDSSVIIDAEMTNDSSVDNTTDLTATNNNPQSAETGEVDATRNTTVSGAVSGDAENDAELSVSADVDNSSATEATATQASDDGQDVDVSNTGPDSTVRITKTVSNSVEVENDTDIEVTNNNEQEATSGDVSASRNTTVDGDVMSGSAMNTSSVEMSFNVTN